MNVGGTILNDLSPDEVYRTYYDSRMASGRHVASAEHDWTSWLRIYVENKLDRLRRTGPRGAQDAPTARFEAWKGHEEPEGGISPPPPDLVAALGNIGSGGAHLSPSPFRARARSK